MHLQPETYLLRVTVIEARDILQMDPNGTFVCRCVICFDNILMKSIELSLYLMYLPNESKG